MTDRALRFAARVIAVGLLGVAWTIGTLSLVIVNQGTEATWRQRLLGYMGLVPVAVLLVYVILSDFADWHLTRRAGGEDAPSED